MFIYVATCSENQSKAASGAISPRKREDLRKRGVEENEPCRENLNGNFYRETISQQRTS